MKLMTEVFDAWRAERLQKPQKQQFAPFGVGGPQALHYQHPHHQQQAAYYYNNNNNVVAEFPAQVFPMSPPLTPVELAGDTTVVAASPVPSRTTSTEVGNSSACKHIA
jgi:hypothetical protein